MDDLARRQRQTGIRLVARSTVGDAVNLDIIFSFFSPRGRVLLSDFSLGIFSLDTRTLQTGEESECFACHE